MTPSKYERVFKTKGRKVRASEVDDWFSVIEADPLQYVFVPQKEKTYELTKAAVSAYGWNIRWAPKEQRTEEICDLAIIEDSESVVFMEEAPCRHQVEAVHTNPAVINLIPNPCDEAVQELKKRSPETLGRNFVLRKNLDKKK